MYASLIGQQYAGVQPDRILVRNGRAVTVVRVVEFHEGMAVCLTNGDRPNPGCEKHFDRWAADNQLVLVTDGVSAWVTFGRWVEREIHTQRTLGMI